MGPRTRGGSVPKRGRDASARGGPARKRLKASAKRATRPAAPSPPSLARSSSSDTEIEVMATPSVTVAPVTDAFQTFRKLCKNRIVSVDELRHAKFAKIALWVEFFKLGPFISQQPRGSEGQINEFYRNLTVDDQSFTLTSFVDGIRICASKDSLSALIGAKSDTEKTLKVEHKHILARFFPGLAKVCSQLPHRASPSLLESHYRVLHFIVAHILVPREGANNVTYQDACLMYKISKQNNVDFAARIMSQMKKAATTKATPLPYLTLITRLLEAHGVACTSADIPLDSRASLVDPTNLKLGGLKFDEGVGWTRDETTYQKCLRRTLREVNRKRGVAEPPVDSDASTAEADAHEPTELELLAHELTKANERLVSLEKSQADIFDKLGKLDDIHSLLLQLVSHQRQGSEPPTAATPVSPGATAPEAPAAAAPVDPPPEAPAAAAPVVPPSSPCLAIIPLPPRPFFPFPY